MKPADPTKAATAQYSYAFAGWTPTIAEVTGDATYTATYTETVRSYTITWKDDDDSVIDTTTVAYGTTPTHAAPTKTATAQYSYAFAGWSPQIADVTGDATYKATFNAMKKSYTITWKNDDGSVIDTTTVAYGETPTHADPTKAATAQYSYVFKGWTPDIVSVTGAATYTAKFIAVPCFDTPTFRLPASTVSIGESAFEGVSGMTVVEIPSGCRSIGKWAFKDCVNLTQIRIPVSVTDIDETAFEGCEAVFIFGTASSAAQTFCDGHDNCTFVAENTGA